MLNCTIAGYLQGEDTPFENALAHVERDAPAELAETLRLVPDHIHDSQLETSGYVIHILQTALYDALTADSAEEAIVSAVNRGGDTDTIGAVTGAVAGAPFGSKSLPDRWLCTIEYQEDIDLLAQALATIDIDPP